MPFRCPQCRTVDSLEIECSIDLPDDRRSYDLSLQVVGCCVCSFRGLAIYREARFGSLEAEDWSHIGYWVSPDAVAQAVSAIRACPDPHDSACRCPVHAALIDHDLSGSWRGLTELERGHTFSMRLHTG